MMHLCKVTSKTQFLLMFFLSFGCYLCRQVGQLMAEMSAELAHKYLTEGEDLKGKTPIDVELVTFDNIAQFQE